MKAQVSVEFMSLLVVSLLVSAILTSEVAARAGIYGKSTDLSEAEEVSKKTAYSLDYASTFDGNLSLDYSPGLRQNYNVTLDSDNVEVVLDQGSAVVPTSFSGEADLNTSGSYVIQNGGIELE